MIDQSQETIAFIFARGGSKGIPNKNLLKLGGESLIQISINHAKSTPEISRVIVSTDSTEIAKAAQSSGAEVPFLRPASLATDSAAEIEAWKHSLRYLLDTEGCLPKAMVSLPTTSPLRKIKDVSSAIELFNSSDADVVVAVTKANRNPYFNMLIEADGLMKLENQFHSVYRRQDAPEFFDLTTVVYVADPFFVLETQNLLAGRVRSINE